MDIIAALGAITRTLLDPFGNLLDQRSLFSYAGALAFLALFVTAARLRRRRGPVRLRAVWRLVARPTVWLHRSARLDYRLYLLNLPLIAFVLGFLYVGAQGWTQIFARVLDTLLGPAPASGNHSWAVIAGVASILLLAVDGAYWAGHMAMHKSPFLWQFHKLHHSAEVMTPATEFRQHPLELVWIPAIIALMLGLTYALITRWLGARTAGMGLGLYGMMLCMHMASFHHLRHSHIAMRFSGIAGFLFHSPAHHMIHHSADPAHFDRNMGYMLSIWDWMAGTLRMPRAGERITLGIGPEGAEHNSVGSALWLPVRDAAKIVLRGLPRVSRRRTEHVGA